MHTTSTGATDEAIHRLVFEHPDGPGRGLEIGGIDHQHGARILEMRQEAEAQSAPVEQREPCHGAVAAQALDDPHTHAVIRQQGIADTQHQRPGS